MTAPKKRGQGEDSIYREGDRWRGQASLGRGPDGKRRRATVSGRTKAEVVSKLREVHRAHAAGVSNPTERMSVGDFFDLWITGLTTRLEQNTSMDYADTVRLHLRPALGHKRLNELSVADANALWASKLKQGYKPNSVRIMRAVLRSALRHAEKEGILVRNVAALSDPPKLSHEDGRALTINQARQLLSTAAGDRLESLYLVALIFGLRRGEALGLAWDDVDLDHQAVLVRRQLVRVRLSPDERALVGRSTRLELLDLKTRKSRRRLHLSDELVQSLVEHRGRQKAERATADEAWTETGMVFTTAIGSSIDPANYSHLFIKLCEDAGLGKWHLHELRHSAASIMLAQGTPLHVVSEVLGHSSVSITKDVYGHLIGGEKQAATEAISGLLVVDRSNSEAEGSAQRVGDKQTGVESSAMRVP